MKIHELSDRKMMLLENDCITNLACSEHGYEPHNTAIIKQYVKPGMTCLDIGANCGCHTVTMAKQTGPSGVVHAFEPQRIVFQQLNGNVFLNELYNVVTHNVALSDTSGLARMTTPDFKSQLTNIGNEHLKFDDVGEPVPKRDVGEPVPKRRLWEVLDHSTDVHFIKMDIQGHELHALKGATGLIMKCKPLMIVEIEDHQLAHFKVTVDSLMSYLTNELGYHVYVIDDLSDDLCVHPDNPVDLSPFGSRLRRRLGA